MEAIPLENDSIDCVLSNGGFCLVPDKRKAFSEIKRVLVPGGRLSVACTVLRKPLPDIGRRWPPCMEVFMLRDDITPVLTELGFMNVAVDVSNNSMGVWDVREDDAAEVASAVLGLDAGMGGDGGGGGGGCSHAIKAAKRRAAARVTQYLSSEREAGVHSGSPEYAFTEAIDMDELCERVVIYAEVPSR